MLGAAHGCISQVIPLQKGEGADTRNGKLRMTALQKDSVWAPQI